MLKEFELRQYAGWSLNSDMPRVYINFRGNESTKSLLKVYEVSPKNGNGNSSVNLLSPKICSNCNQENTIHTKFCANPKCRMVLRIDAYFETLQQQKEKELEIQKLQEKYEQDMKAMREELEVARKSDYAVQTGQIKELQRQVVEINKRDRERQQKEIQLKEENKKLGRRWDNDKLLYVDIKMGKIVKQPQITCSCCGSLYDYKQSGCGYVANNDGPLLGECRKCCSDNNKRNAN